MSLPEVHDGEAVRKALKSAGMSAKALGETLGNTNIYKWLHKKHWPTDMLFRAGEVLGVYFFEPYQPCGINPADRPFIGLFFPLEKLNDEELGEWMQRLPKGMNRNEKREEL